MTSARELGLSGLGEVFAALRDSSGKIPAEEAMRQAAGAVRRAEARAHEFFPAPLPPPCQVAPMPEVVAVSGAAPHYTPPRLDGGRPGTFWFNTQRPTATAHSPCQPRPAASRTGSITPADLVGAEAVMTAKRPATGQHA